MRADLGDARRELRPSILRSPLSSPSLAVSPRSTFTFRLRIVSLAGLFLFLACTEFPKPRQSPDGGDAGGDARMDGRGDARDTGPAGDLSGGDVPIGSCQPDEHECAGTCFKNNDPTSCGVCGHDCTGLPNVKPGSVQCQAGKCVVAADGCVAAFAHCSANPDEICETDISKPENCGACGRKCMAAAPLCSNVGGTQTCVLGCSGAAPDQCGNSCVDLKTDVNNCATCGKICSFPNGEASCVNGACVMTRCKNGYGDCTAEPGCETQLNTTTNCGMCGAVCGAAKPICSTVGGLQTCVGKPNGQTCSSSTECANGNCVDGVCCNTACSGQCEACDVNGSIGTCKAVTGAPHRSAQPARALCGGDPACGGMCNGTVTAACTYPANQCRTASCSAARVQVNAATCDANGVCPAVTTTSCNFACVASTGTCGGTCVPGSKNCSGNTLQVCNSAGAFVTDTACSGNTPKCDPASLTCVKRPLGETCSSPNECASNSCAFGVCCNAPCGTTCSSSCAGGTCVHKTARTSCGKRTGVNPGNNDIFLYCDGGGNCVGPTFRCGSTTSCTLTTNSCCMTNPVSSSGDPIIWGCVNSPAACQHGDGSGDESTNTNHRWKSCKSTLDCPSSGLICASHQGSFGSLGYLFYQCIPPAMLGNTWTIEVCDPTRPVSGQCTNGGTCRSYMDTNDPTGGSCN